MLKYCPVCNAPVVEWDGEEEEYGQCDEGHLVHSAYCFSEPNMALYRRIRRRELYALKKAKE